MNVEIRQHERGYIAYSPEYDCYGDGDTQEAALKDLEEVIEDLIAVYEEVRNGETYNSD